MKATLIEQQSKEGAYGFETEAIIIDTDTHGRLLITDGYGGDDVNGHCYRWRHGVVVQLKANDSFEVLAKPWNDFTSTITAATTDNDPERPVLKFSGYAIAAIAKSLGLT
jgi:hypothetical protein